MRTFRKRTTLSLNEETRKAEKQADDERPSSRSKTAVFVAKGEEPVCHHGRAPRNATTPRQPTNRPRRTTRWVRETAHVLLDMMGLSQPLALAADAAAERGGAVGRTPQSTASASERLAMALANAVSNAAKGMVVCSLTP